MKAGQKRITALGLILLLAIPLWLSVVFIVKQKILRLNIQSRFGKELIQTITVSKKNLVWAKKEKEIIVKGKYFDVMNYTTSGDEVLLTGFYDNKEDDLVKKIKILIRQKKESNNSANQLAINFLSTIIYFSQAEITYNVTWHFISGHYRSFDECLTTEPIPTPTQPPKLSISSFI
ncbi:MAG: hypothetical protein ABIO79_00955 [Ferruginibacter sp.]